MKEKQKERKKMLSLRNPNTIGIVLYIGGERQYGNQQREEVIGKPSPTKQRRNQKIYFGEA